MRGLDHINRAVMKGAQAVRGFAYIHREGRQ